MGARMELDFTGHTVIVTGGASGIGQAIIVDGGALLPEG